MIIVGLSGGVDSAVAALLLREQGHEVQGLFMANWSEDDSYCTIAADYQDARAVCRELGIPCTASTSPTNIDNGYSTIF